MSWSSSLVTITSGHVTHEDVVPDVGKLEAAPVPVQVWVVHPIVGLPRSRSLSIPGVDVVEGDAVFVVSAHRP